MCMRERDRGGTKKGKREAKINKWRERKKNKGETREGEMETKYTHTRNDRYR